MNRLKAAWKGGGLLPESACWVQARSPKGPPGGLRGQVCGQGWHGLCIVAWVVGKLDCDGLSGALWQSPVQFLDGALSLDTLVETNKTDTFGQTLKRERKQLKSKNQKIQRELIETTT